MVTEILRRPSACRAKPLVNLSFGPQAPGPFPDRTGEHCAPQLRRFLRLERPVPRRLAMLPWGLSCLSALGAVGTALLGAGLLLSLAQHLWTLRWTLSRDRASALPLPKGSMGWPFFGETLHWLVQVSTRSFPHLFLLCPPLPLKVPRARSHSPSVAQGSREHIQPSPLPSFSLEGTVCHWGSLQHNLRPDATQG